MFKSLKDTTLGVLVLGLVLSSFIAPLTNAAPGDITYKPALGKLGQNNPFKAFSDPKIMAVDSTGTIYVSDFYEGRVVKMNADGSNPIILAMASPYGNYTATEYSQNNIAGLVIRGIAIGANDTVYITTVAGINTFSAAGEYLSFHPFEQTPIGNAPQVSSRILYSPATNSFYSYHEECTVQPSFECEPNSFKSIVNVYSLTGRLTDRKIYDSSDTNKASSYYFLEVLPNSQFSVITSKDITVFNSDLSIDSTQDMTREVQAVHRSSQNAYTYTYAGQGSPLDTETFSFTGQSIATGTITSEDLAAKPLQTVFDTIGNRYEFEGDYAVRSITKYSANNDRIFVKNETPELGTFASPITMAIDSKKNTYVYDLCTIQKFSDDGTALFRFGKNGFGAGEFSCGINSIAVDKNDNLIVYDAGVGTLIVFSESGEYIRTVEINQDFSNFSERSVSKLIVNAAGDVYLFGYQGVIKYTSNIASPTYIPFKNALEPNQVMSGYAVDKQGQFYLLDGNNFKVLKFDSEGNYLLSFGEAGEAEENFGLAYAINVDLPGNVYIADIRPADTGDYYTTIKKFGSEGQFLLKFGSSNPTDPFYMNTVTSILVNPDYEIFALDQITTEVKRYEVEKNDSSIISADGRRVIDNPAISKQPTFTGATEPYATVTVVVRSDPVTCTATADAAGNWSCTLPSELPAGQHTMRASINLADDSTLELGPFPVRVLGGVGTPGTSLGEGLFAPNTGVLMQTPLLRTVTAAILAFLTVIATIVLFRTVKMIRRK